MFSLINIKVNFNFEIRQTQSRALIIVNTFHVTSLMRVGKNTDVGFISSIHLNRRLINTAESKGKTLVTKIS